MEKEMNKEKEKEKEAEKESMHLANDGIYATAPWHTTMEQRKNSIIRKVDRLESELQEMSMAVSSSQSSGSQ